MRRALVAVALLASGCSLLFAPDRDEIRRPDASLDAGIDADVFPDGGDGGEDGGDAGYDGGGCTPNEALEVSCSDGVDNDCDRNVDCADPDCAADGYCCDLGRGTTAWTGDLVTFPSWQAHGSTPTAGAANVEFGTGIGQRVHPDCAPLAFGVRLSLSFSRAGGPAQPTHFASLVLAPVRTPRVGGDRTLLADLTLRVSGDGRARLERAGALLGQTPDGTELPVGASDARIDLTPSIDAAGRPILLVSATIGDFALADGEMLMPLTGLVDAGGGCSPDGLFVAVEGRGDAVTIGSALSTRIGSCNNPTQFLSDAMGPLADASLLPPDTGDWRAGGAGEPTLATRASMGATSELSLLFDASRTERSDEIFRFVDFAIAGSFRSNSSGGWLHRTRGAGGHELIGPSPVSSREPAFVVGEGLDPHFVLFARRRATGGDVYELARFDLDDAIAASPTPTPLLVPGRNDDVEIDCVSLRDPAAIALDGRNALFVLFTCERQGEPSHIAGVRVRRDAAAPNGYRVTGAPMTLLAPEIGAYASQGVWSPELVVTSVDAAARRVSFRLWFLARDGDGEVRVGLAYGDVDASEGSSGAPRLGPYPGNPILSAEDPLLGGPCPGGCLIESLGVAATVGRPSLWPDRFGREPSYVFLVERSVFRAGGVDHQLIPLRQPRPSGG
ncbi:MAG: hypothetical protein KF729_24950 [Sandaracinaceae bacterium]|nr:hypothetical protein [Sandaracinaceae bacterium]